MIHINVQKIHMYRFKYLILIYLAMCSVKSKFGLTRCRVSRFIEADNVNTLVVC